MTSAAVNFPISAVEGLVLGLLTDPETQETKLTLTESDVDQAFRTALAQLPTEASEKELEELRRLILETVGADIPTPSTPVVKKDHQPWLPSVKSSIDWRRWRAYRKHLSKNGIPGLVLDKLDQFSDDILDLAGNPKTSGTWNNRGLIIGDVQSGKTQNYLAIANKAADAGYRLIIILSGNTEYLRRQTHERLDEGFIGRDTTHASAPKGVAVNKDQFIGIGKIDRDIANATSLTTVLMDYLQASKKAAAVPLPTTTSGPVVFVLKKNRHVLDAVESWAKSQVDQHGKIDLPLLLLDDESDYASINTNEAEDPTAINSAIRRILSRFSRSSYAAITATPFANIFIDNEASGVVSENGREVDDLFPDDYIYPLEAPTNYVGIRATFGTDETDQPNSVLPLEDAEAWIPVKHKKTQRVGAPPASLKKAIKTYLLANAILDRSVKGPRKRSMLINVSRFTDVQNAVAERVSEVLYAYKSAIEMHALTYADGKPNDILAELEETYTTQFGKGYPSWDAILQSLHKSVAPVQVKVYNSNVNTLGEDEEYKENAPSRQIAVGGDLLSRGLTLNGLIVSYFHRSVGAADTMMQMARWFGYRDGYRDLCRLWIDDRTASDYRFIGNAVQELRDDLAHMHRNNMTPRDFGLAVKQHPESLLITARNKSKNTLVSEKEVNLLGRNLETRKLSADPDIQDNNFDAVTTLITNARGAGCNFGETRRKHRKIFSVPKNYIADLLHSYEGADDDIFFSGTGLERMVRASHGERFDKWDVVFVNGDSKKGTLVRKKGTQDRILPGQSVYHVERELVLRKLISKRSAETSSIWVSGKKTRLAGSDDLRKVLGRKAEADALATYQERHPGSTQKPQETAFYEFLERPQLMIYAVTPNKDGLKVDNDTDSASESEATREALHDNTTYMALKVALPISSADYLSSNGRAKYLLNSVAQKYWMLGYEELR